jgi:hypothetical protein
VIIAFPLPPNLTAGKGRVADRDWIRGHDFRYKADDGRLDCATSIRLSQVLGRFNREEQSDEMMGEIDGGG